MTTTQQPAALRLAQELDAVPETGADPQTIQDTAAELRRLHAYCQELESQVVLDCMTHVQNPASPTAVNRYCRAGMCVPSDTKHEPCCTAHRDREIEIESLRARSVAPAGEYPALPDDSEAFKTYLKECDECAIVPDVAGAFNAAWQIASHGHAQAAPQTSPAAQGDALSDDAVRVPPDNLHADAAYLIGRLREGSMPHARVIEIIRERIDAAKAAIRARAAQGDALDTERLNWLTFNLSGKALRNIGVVWSEHGDARRAIDAARAAQEGK